MELGRAPRARAHAQRRRCLECSFVCRGTDSIPFTVDPCVVARSEEPHEGPAVGSSFCWECPCLREEAGELPLLFVDERSQTKHRSSTTGEQEINLPREKKGEGSSSLSSGTTQSHSITQNVSFSSLALVTSCCSL